MLSLHGQKEDYVWLLGYGNNPDSEITGDSRIDFNTEPPTISLVPQPIDFYFSDASICNGEGDLLIYTNGATVGNANNEVMENGDSLGLSEVQLSYALGSGNSSAPPAQQGVIILNIPQQDSQYMIIHHELSEDVEDIVPGLANIVFRVFYSMVKIDTENPFGKVIEKNTLLLEDIFDRGRMSSIKHANGSDWWILLNKRETNEYYTLRLGPTGIEEIFTQATGSITQSGIGQASFSPDGSKYARNAVKRAGEPGQMDVYDFDRCSGLLSNPQHIVIDTVDGRVEVNLGGVVFSPNSKLLYLTGKEKIIQYDLEAADLLNSGDTVAIRDDFRDTLFNFPTPFGVTQLAPNGKIYMATTTNTKHLHVIHDPNIRGVGCNVEQHAIELPRLNNRSIPNHPNYRLKALIGSPCDTIRPLAAFTYDTLSNTVFTDQSARTPTEWQWTFGDGNSSTEQNPSHTYTENGTYEVCLVVSNEAGSDTTCQQVTVVVTSTRDLAKVSFKVFPNPTRGRVTVSLPNDASRSWRLMNVLGQEVERGVFSAVEATLDLRKFGSGVYWLEVEGLGSEKVLLNTE